MANIRVVILVMQHITTKMPFLIFAVSDVLFCHWHLCKPHFYLNSM